jgi:hypothetical protein
MKTMHWNELEAAVREMRRLGVTQWNGIVLGADPVKPVDTEAEVKKIVKPGVRGKDGYTYEQQVETYGAAIDATPDIYEE